MNPFSQPNAEVHDMGLNAAHDTNLYMIANAPDNHTTFSVIAVIN